MTLVPQRILSYLYKAATGVRNYLYEISFFDSLKLHVPVISIGNITVGGTGKTPVTQLLLSYFQEKGIKPTVVSRNYKAMIRGTAQVDVTKSSAAQFYGDEPTLLAFKNPKVPIYVGPTKWYSALFAQEKSQAQVIIVDDGFQHRALHRNLDIVLLDATAPFFDYEFLPLGKGRESFAALKRAGIVLITKVNFVDQNKLQQMKQKLSSYQNVFEVSYHLQSLVTVAAQKAIAFAGLARPESFKESLQAESKIEIMDFISFPDHHLYTEQDIKKIRELKNRLGAEVILTTQKDWMKVRELVSEPSEFHVFDLLIKITGPTLNSSKEFYAILDQVLHI